MKSTAIVAIMAVLAMAIAPLWSVNAAADEATEPIVPTTAYEWEIINFDGQEHAVSKILLVFLENGVPRSWNFFDCFPTQSPLDEVLVIMVDMGYETEYQDGEDMVITVTDNWDYRVYGNTNGYAVRADRNNEIHGVESWWGMCNGEPNRYTLMTLDAALNIIRNIENGDYDTDSSVLQALMLQYRPIGDFEGLANQSIIQNIREVLTPEQEAKLVGLNVLE